MEVMFGSMVSFREVEQIVLCGALGECPEDLKFEDGHIPATRKDYPEIKSHGPADRGPLEFIDSAKWGPGGVFNPKDRPSLAGAKLEVSLDGGNTFHEVEPGGRLPAGAVSAADCMFKNTVKYDDMLAKGDACTTAPACDCGAKPGELHFQFCKAYQPIRGD